jgi:hypothetical protein
MGFRKLRLAPIVSWVSEDGYPIYGPFVRLQDVPVAQELNSIELSLNNVTKEKTYQADDREEVKKVTVRAEGTLKVYDCLPEVCRAMFGFSTDANGNTIENLNNIEKKHYGLFFESKSANGKRYQKYLYDVEFEEISPTFATDTGENDVTLEIPFKVKFAEINGTLVRAATVYEGNVGWIAGEPEVMYKGTGATSSIPPLSAPFLTVDSNNNVLWSGNPGAVGYVVVVNGTAKPVQLTTIYPTETIAGTYVIYVIAKGNGATFVDSTPSNTITYTVA